MIPRPQNVVVIPRLPKWLATGLPVLKTCTLLECIHKFHQVTCRRCALHYHMKVVRHDAIGVQREFVPQTRCHELCKRPASLRLFSEYWTAFLATYRDEVNPAAAILFCVQSNLRGIEGHGGQRTTAPDESHYLLCIYLYSKLPQNIPSHPCRRMTLVVPFCHP